MAYVSHPLDFSQCPRLTNVPDAFFFVTCQMLSWNGSYNVFFFFFSVCCNILGIGGCFGKYFYTKTSDYFELGNYSTLFTSTLINNCLLCNYNYGSQFLFNSMDYYYSIFFNLNSATNSNVLCYLIKKQF